MSRCIDLPVAQCQAVASFYDMFFLEPVGEHVVEVCTNVSCCLVGATDVVAAVRAGARLPARRDLARRRRDAALGRVPRRLRLGPGRLGRPPLPRALHRRRRAHGRRRPPVPRGRPLMQGPTYAAAARPTRSCSTSRANAPTSPTTRPRAATRPRSPQAARPFDEFVQELKDSGLRGRGGAGFPTGMKVSFIGKGERAPGRQRRRVRARHLQGPRADAAQPARADRGLHHALQRDRLARRLHLHPRRVRDRGRGAGRGDRAGVRARLLGAALPGAPGAVDIYVHRGAGAYICGEETALLSVARTATAASRPRSRRSRPCPVPGRARRCSTTSRRVLTVPYIFAMGARALRGDAHRADHRHAADVAVGPRAAPRQLRAAASTATYRDLIEGCGGGVARRPHDEVLHPRRRRRRRS